MQIRPQRAAVPITPFASRAWILAVDSLSSRVNTSVLCSPKFGAGRLRRGGVSRRRVEGAG